MTFHIQHVSKVFMVWDDKGQHYGTFKTRAEAQARIYELQKAEKKE